LELIILAFLQNFQDIFYDLVMIGMNFQTIFFIFLKSQKDDENKQKYSSFIFSK